MENTDEILAEFIIEAREILDQLDLDFVQLEETPEDKKLVGNIFRGMHTLKGNSGFFAFRRMEKVSHASETLLGKIRDGVFGLDSGKITLLLDALDALRLIVTGVETNNEEPAGDDTGLIEQLLNQANGIVGVTAAPAPVSSPIATATPSPSAPAAPIASATPISKTESIDSDIETSSDNIENEVEEDSSKLSLTLQEAVKADSEPIHEAITTVAKGHELVAAPVRVSLELLDKLMSIVSEMVLARNRLLPYTNELEDHGFSTTVRTIDLLTQELQERMMKTRMQPISQVWSKFPRLVRDVSNDCEKSVRLIQEGTETELDRTLLDAIRDPLVHCIRNCIDHGIESPQDRVALGKPPMGKILLKASHENGMVLIEITDDGAGINFDSVRQSVVRRQFVSAEKAVNLTEQQLLDYIYLPGFSTKLEVTNLSGRGVGMDVVKTNVSQVGGSVEVDTVSSVGTTVRMKIPLTLAIMPALFVRCESQQYAIPQNSIVETVRLDVENEPTGLEDFYGTPVFRLRGRLVPVVFLNWHLELSHRKPRKDEPVTVIILQSAGIQYGLMVDEVMNMQEVVVKALGPVFKGTVDFAGATILGDGTVSLILDPDGIAQSCGLVEKVQLESLKIKEETLVETEQTSPMLLFELDGLERLAIPLGYVDRLESISPDKIQRNGKREVVKYREGIMHLLRLNEYVDGAQTSNGAATSDQPLSVITHYMNQTPVGLVVSKVHDIIHVPNMTHETNPRQRGLMGCVLLNDKVINVIDLKEILMARSLQDNEMPRQSIIDMDVVQ
jgi:two-component system chemotaxis sensor kinase CheA